MANEIYRILYVENNAEKVNQLRQLIRSSSVESKITFDVTTTDSVEGINLSISKNSCDLIILQDSPKVPSLKEINDAIGVNDIPVLVLVSEDQFLAKRQSMIQEGAVDVGILQQGQVLFKQIVRTIFELKTQIGYRETLEKNAKLSEITAQLTAVSEDVIAYFSEDGLFLYANEAFLHYFKLKDFNDLAATTVLEYIEHAQSAQFKKMMKIVSKTGKELSEALTLKNPANGETQEENIILRQAMFEEIPCLEILIAKEGGTSTSVAISTDVPVLSEQAKFYDRLLFIDGLSNFVGSSSWLVCLVLQDYFSFRKKYGVKVLEAYFLKLSEHLGAQISNLHYARYSDESIVLLLTNSDMTKVDRLGMAIVSSSEGFVFTQGEASLQGKFTFAYTNLGDSIASVADSCNRLDELSGLLNARVVFTDDEGEVEDSEVTEDSTLGGDLEEEYLPLHAALQNQLIKQTYVPVVDFSMKGQENYIASFNLYDKEGGLVIWNKSFAYTSSNSLMRTLDLFMMEQAVKSLTGENPAKRIMIPLSMYFLTKVDELIAWIQQNGHGLFAQQISLALAEEVIADHFDAAKAFYHALKDAGCTGAVYDVVDITTTQVDQLDITLVALSENCISRMSRSMTGDEMIKFPKLLESLNHKGASVLAMGVNSPTSMTLVWEYNIPYACGNMIGAASTALDFDFSQVIM